MQSLEFLNNNKVDLMKAWGTRTIKDPIFEEAKEFKATDEDRII